MNRLISHAFAFCIAGATAYASLADASEGQASETVQAQAAVAPALTVVEAALPGLEVGTEPVNWAVHIERRLTELESKRPPHGEHSRSFGALAERLDAVADRAGREVRIAVHVRDLASGQTAYDLDGSRPLNPASNQKLLTSIAAVELLGEDYQFETRLARDGDTLYLIGGGDPTLELDDLYTMAAVARGRLDGIERIVADDSAFTERRFGPGYDPDGPGLAYMAPSGALSLTFNTVQVVVRPGAYNGPVEVEVQPESTHVVVESQATTGGGSRLKVDTERRGDQTVVKLSGSLAAGHAPVRLRRRIYEPGLFTAGALAQILADVGDTAPLPVERGTSPDTARPLATHRSAALPRALESALKYSNNFCTEQTLRTLGWRATGRPGSWENGTAVIQRFWSALGSDQELDFVNGSGLSRNGRATPRALVDLLTLTQDDSRPSASLHPVMAGAGGEGTLRLRMAQAEGRIRAKTGTMNGVSALSGIVASQDGERRLGFSILVNGGDAATSRSVQDRMVLAMLANVDAE